jgi:hypothetical protein
MGGAGRRAGGCSALDRDSQNWGLTGIPNGSTIRDMDTIYSVTVHEDAYDCAPPEAFRRDEADAYAFRHWAAEWGRGTWHDTNHWQKVLTPFAFSVRLKLIDVNEEELW